MKNKIKLIAIKDLVDIRQISIIAIRKSIYKKLTTFKPIEWRKKDKEEVDETNKKYKKAKDEYYAIYDNNKVDRKLIKEKQNAWIKTHSDSLEGTYIDFTNMKIVSFIKETYEFIITNGHLVGLIAIRDWYRYLNPELIHVNDEENIMKDEMWELYKKTTIETVEEIFIVEDK